MHCRSAGRAVENRTRHPWGRGTGAPSLSPADRPERAAPPTQTELQAEPRRRKRYSRGAHRVRPRDHGPTAPRPHAHTHAAWTGTGPVTALLPATLSR